MLAWLLIVHFIADFLLQPREMAVGKSSDRSWLILHAVIIYWAFFFGTGFNLNFALMNACVHAFIDMFIWKGYKWKRRFKTPDFKYWQDHLFYTFIGFDQLLHGLTIVWLWKWLIIGA